MRSPAARRSRPARGPVRRLAPLLAAAALAAPPLAAQLVLELQPVATGLARPLAVTHAGDGSGRLFIAEQPGRIRVHDGTALRAEPFLDLGSLTTCCGEKGLLGLAFHPGYAANGEFFVAYTDLAGSTVVARYEVSAADPDRADPDSAEILLTIAQPYANHNGGNLAFGPDGYLYVGVGDGGSGGDPENRAQNLGTLLGKLLRIDVDATDPGLAYAIPPDNPFVADPAAADEIWAYGLRNPWRFSFDRQTGDLWLGDVGQNALEEIDFQPAASGGGENYGWRLKEGSACFDPPTGCDPGGLTDPVLEYSHAFGCSVTGGYRYRGTAHPRLRGVYLYGDFCFGTVWGTVPRCDGTWESQPLLESGLSVSSFGEDEAGELYLVHLASTSGAVYRLGLAPGSGGPALAADPPALDFGAHLVGSTETLELSLVHPGPGPEAVAVERLETTDPARFVLDAAAGAAPCGPTPCLAPGTSCTVEVTFDGSALGIWEAELRASGNFEPLVVPLDGAAYEPCPHPSALDLQSMEIVDAQLFQACRSITTGPDFAVAPTGDATLRAGTEIALGEGTRVERDARLVLELDPLLALGAPP